MVFEDFRIAEHYQLGVSFFKANFTREPPQVTNSTIIGISSTNAEMDLSKYGGIGGIRTGQSGSYNLSNIRFYNYP